MTKQLKSIFVIWIGMISLMLFSGCGQAEKSLDDKVETTLKSLSRQEKLGQMVMIGIQGKSANNDSRFMINQYHIGGIILFDRNLETLDQTQRLTADLQKEAGGKIPLFIAIDEEGGKVVRMPDIIEPPPAQLDIGQMGNPELAYEWANKTAKSLQKAGINLNFAPVADIGSLSSRHYSENAVTVTEFVRKAAQGYKDAGIMYSLKHFPGIGKGETDTHTETVVISAAKEELQQEDIVPFAKMIAENDPNDFQIMVSHAVYLELSGDKPASMSAEIMDDLLRKQLGYHGVIITDDLEMKAVAKDDNFKQLGVKAIKAGADIVLVCHEYEHEAAVYLGLLEAVEKGEITEERVDASVRRILKMKLRNRR